MTVRFLHTADWHLGQLFHNYPRDYEHAKFLTWLIAQIKEKQPHALLIAGDIFDVINPSSQAQKKLNRFLADAHEVAPQMQTLLTTLALSMFAVASSSTRILASAANARAKLSSCRWPRA